MRNTAWIWFVGCVVWFGDGLAQLRVHAQAHAELAFMLALLFLVAASFIAANQDKSVAPTSARHAHTSLLVSD